MKSFIQCLAGATVLLTAACAADSASGSTKLGTQAPVVSPGVGGTVAMNVGASGIGAANPTKLGASGVTGTAGTVAPPKPTGTSGSAPSNTPPPIAGTGAAAAGVGGAKPAGTGGTTPVMLGPNQTLPPVTDYTQPGPFNPTTTMDGTGPDGMYTVFQPTNLDQNGFKFVPLTWGNGITTTPQTYPILLSTVASHGFVVIASDSSTVTSDQMSAGLDWLIKQNDVAGPYQGKLDVTRAISMGYSLGGGAALTAGNDPRVIATIGMHPAPGNSAGLHGPLLLFTGDQDTIVAPTLVDASFAASNVPTFYVSLSGATHFEPVLSGGQELGPCIAWLRLFTFHDEGAKAFFIGDSCTMCKSPWTPQSKMWPPPGI